jgi:hypothetical protein
MLNLSTQYSENTGLDSGVYLNLNVDNQQDINIIF